MSLKARNVLDVGRRDRSAYKGQRAAEMPAEECLAKHASTINSRCRKCAGAVDPSLGPQRQGSASRGGDA